VIDLPPHFVHRENESSELLQWLMDDGEDDDLSLEKAARSVCILSRIPNGKTTLASYVVHEMCSYFGSNHRIMWLNVGMGGSKRLEYLFASVLNQLLCITSDPSPQDKKIVSCLGPQQSSAAIAALCRFYCDGNSPTVVLDNVCEIEVIEAFEGTGLKLIVTTRSDAVASRVGLKRTINLQGLEETHSKCLLGKTSQRRHLPLQCDEVIEKMGRSPLAAVVVGTALRHAFNWQENMIVNHVEKSRGCRSMMSLRSIPEGLDHFKATKEAFASSVINSDSDSEGMQFPIRLGEVSDVTKLKNSLLMAIKSLPSEFFEMFIMLTVFPPCVPLTTSILSAIWDVDRNVACIMATSMNNKGLLTALNPGVFCLMQDIHEIAKNYGQEEKKFSMCKSLASKNALSHLNLLDTLYLYFWNQEIHILLQLWTNFRPHEACKCYVSHMEKIVEQCDWSSVEIDQNVVILMIVVAQFTVVSSCGCSVKKIFSMVRRVKARLSSASHLMSRLLGQLHYYLAMIRIQGQLFTEALEDLQTCLFSNPDIDTGKIMEIEPSQLELKLTMRTFDEINACYEVKAFETLAKVLMKEYSDTAAERAIILTAHACYLRSRLFSHKEELVWVVDGWNNFELANMLRRAGELDRASSLYNRSLNLFYDALGILHPLRASCFEGLGKVAVLRGYNYLDEAKELFREAHSMRVKYYGELHVCVAKSLECQASVSSQQGDFDEARSLLEESMELKRAVYNSEHLSIAKTLRLLAAVLIKIIEAHSTSKFENAKVFHRPPSHNKYPRGSFSINYRIIDRMQSNNMITSSMFDIDQIASKAEDCLRRAMTILDTSSKIEAPMNQALGETVQLLYRLLMQTDRIEEAKPLAEKWVEWLEKTKKIHDYEYSRSIADLIWIKRELGGKDENVESLMYDLLAVDRKVYGDESLEVAADQEGLAAIVQEKGMFSQAEQLLKAILNTRIKICGPDSVEVARSHLEIGKNLAKSHAYREAETYLREAQRINIIKLGIGNMETVACMRELGIVLCKLAKYREAEPIYAEVIKADLMYYKTEECAEVIKSLNTLAILRYAIGRPEAADMLRKVLALREKFYGPYHPDVSDSLINLAALYSSSTQYEEALPMLQRSLEICRSVHGPSHPDTLTCLDRLAELHQKMRHYNEAEAMYLEALRLNQETEEDRDYLVSEIMSDLGQLYARTGRLKEAEEMHLNALKIRKDLFGEIHDSVADSYLNLSLLVNQLERTQEAEVYNSRLTYIKDQLAMGSRIGRSRSDSMSPMNGNSFQKSDPTGFAVSRSISNMPC